MPAPVADDVRAPGRRSRHGCHACRIRRKKCDETRPTCNACAERNLECVYPIFNQIGPSRPQKLARKTAPIRDALELPRPRGALVENEQFLLHHFSRALTRLLSFRPEGSNNAFCIHLLPLTESSSVVLGAVETISTAHLHMLGSKPLADASDMHSMALRSLSSHLSTDCLNGSSGEVALTAILLMVYYEVILGDSAENALCHLTGAKAILEGLANAPSTTLTGRLRFLMKIFHYFDVMVALSLRKTPLGLPYNPELSLGPVDEIFGLTAPLWPTMHLVAQVLADKDKALANEETIVRAYALVEQLSGPYTVASMQEEFMTNQSLVDLEALVQISNAYRCSVLLVLHHEVLNTKDPQILNRIYREALDSLLRIAALDGPMATYSTSVWPLFTVGRYAQSTSDRTILRHIFSKIYRRHAMKIVETADQSMSQLWNTGVDGSTGPVPSVFFA